MKIALIVTSEFDDYKLLESDKSEYIAELERLFLEIENKQ